MADQLALAGIAPPAEEERCDGPPIWEVWERWFKHLEEIEKRTGRKHRMQVEDGVLVATLEEPMEDT